MINKNLAWALVASLLVVLFANAAEAGNCHGAPKGSKVTQSVVVDGGSVRADESVVIDGGAVVADESVTVCEPSTDITVGERVTVSPGANVTVNESVTVGGSPSGSSAGGPPISVHNSKKDARAAKRATIAEAKAARKSGRFARKSYNAEHEAMNDAAVKRIYSN